MEYALASSKGAWYGVTVSSGRMAYGHSGVQAPIMPLWSPSGPQPIEYYACLKIVARGTTA
eukprot:scaffold3944_cov111-Isochrysis_galbana.AAC.4